MSSCRVETLLVTVSATRVQAERQVNVLCGCSASNAQALAAAPLSAVKKSITGSTMYARERMLAAATHPAVIWQSHLLDVTPASWPSMKARHKPL